MGVRRDFRVSPNSLFVKLEIFYSVALRYTERMRWIIAFILTVNFTLADPPLAPRKANRWPAQVFAPYVDATLWPLFGFAAATKQYGIQFYTLAFIVAKGPNNPAPSWGGYHLVSNRWLLPEINAIRTAGGEVRVSFGGAAGTGLAAACKTPAQLQAAYQVVINTYGLTHIDFDVEGHWLAEVKSIERRSRAIFGLQAQAREA